MSEPKDAAAARRIIYAWHREDVYTPARYVEIKRNNPGDNARGRYSPALKIVIPILAHRAKPVAP